MSIIIIARDGVGIACMFRIGHANTNAFGKRILYDAATDAAAAAAGPDADFVPPLSVAAFGVRKLTDALPVPLPLPAPEGTDPEAADGPAI